MFILLYMFSLFSLFNCNIFKFKSSNNKKIIKELINIKSVEIEEFTLKGIKTVGKVVEIYDGDTCKIVLPLNNKLLKYTCRLNGLDAPEMKPLLSNANREKEIKHAHEARNRLIQLATNCKIEINGGEKKTIIKDLLNDNTKLIYVELFEFDKYGRLLINLYENDKYEKSFNQVLIDENYAVPYDGGTKKIFV
jgi:endonuclease YncB( thermonuclease family)